MPADEAIPHFEALAARSQGMSKADALRPLAVFHAMQGNFEEARSAIADIRAINTEFGARLHMAIRAFWSAPVERLAGDLAAAERELRASTAALEQMGERAYLSTLVGDLGEVLYEQGRYDEAEACARTSEEAAAPDDVASQVIWRVVRAKVLARHGAFDEAERLAREAAALLERSDYLEHKASASLALAEVFRLAGRASDAAEALRDALQFLEAKGDLVLARRTKTLLAQLAGEELAKRE